MSVSKLTSPAATNSQLRPDCIVLPTIEGMNEIERAMLHMVLLQSESGIVLQTNHLYERHVQGGVVTDIHECADALSKMKTKEREIAIAHLLRSLRHEASEIL